MVDTNFYDVDRLRRRDGRAWSRRRCWRGAGSGCWCVGDEPEQAAFDAGGTPLSRAPALLPPLDDPQVGARVQGARLRGGGQAPRAGRRAGAAGGARPAAARSDGRSRRRWSASSARAFGAAAPTLAAAIERLDALGRLVEPLLATAMTLPPERLLGAARGRAPGVAAAARRAPIRWRRCGAEHPFRAVAAAPAALVDRPRPERRRLGRPRRAPSRWPAAGCTVSRAAWRRCRSCSRSGSRRSAGERRRRLEPVEVVVRRGRAVGLRVRPRDETIGCQWLVWAGSAAALRAALGAARPAGAARARARRRCAWPATATRWRCWSGPRRCPPGMPRARAGHRRSGARRSLEDNAIAVTVGRPAPREPERIPLWVECAVPGAPRRRRARATCARCAGGCCRRSSASGPSFGSSTRRASPRRTTACRPSGPAAAAARRPTARRPPRRRRRAPPPLYARAASGPLDVTGLPHATRHQEPAPRRPREPARAGPRGRAGLGLGRRAPGRAAHRSRRGPLGRRTLLGELSDVPAHGCAARARQ